MREIMFEPFTEIIIDAMAVVGISGMFALIVLFPLSFVTRDHLPDDESGYPTPGENG